jgi:hypothetical protein
VLLATWIFAPPQAGEKDERRFEKRNLCSRVPRLRVHVAVSWSHAKSRAVLGGTLGENAAWCSGHGSSAQEDGCGLSPAAGPARHVVLCGHRSVFSSPPGRQNVSPPRIFSTNPLCMQAALQWLLGTMWHRGKSLTCNAKPARAHAIGTWYLVVAYRGNGGIHRGIYQLQGDDNGHVGRPR